MPYNPGTGIYTLPAIYLAVPGTTIIAAQHNTPLEDLEVANNYERPIVAGGTGQNSAVLARGSTGLATMGNIGVKGSNIASAATLTLVDNFNYNHVTGVVTVTAISTRPAGERILLEFEGALLLTHSAALFLQPPVNRTTAAGDLMELVSEGSGNWRQVSYGRAAGSAPTQQFFSTPGAATWTKPLNCIRAEFEGCGAGGGSGGVDGQGAGTSAATGGGASGFSGTTGIIDVTAVASAALSVGAGGAAGTSSGNGSAGGNTTVTVGATVYTFGGGGGSEGIIAGGSAGSKEGGDPGVGTNVVGFSQQGCSGIRGNQGTNTDNNVTGGAGGSSLFGTGGIGRHSITPGASGGGLPGVGFGAGGSGAFNISNAANSNGAAGTGGCVRVTEYYS